MDKNIYQNLNRGLYKTGNNTYDYKLGLPSNQIKSVSTPQVKSGYSIDQQNRSLGHIIAGKKGFNNDDTGYILGVDKGVPKFFIGDNKNYLNWDGEALRIHGIFDVGGTVVTIDDTDDIQTYLNFISEQGGGTLYLSPGTYTLTADISIPDNCNLEGVVRNSCIIECGDFSVKMSGSSSYSTGTVTINNGDTTVVGTGTNWTWEQTGKSIWLDGLWYTVVNVVDTTHITVSDYVGNNLAGESYTIAIVLNNPKISKLTIQNSSGDGIEIKYTNNPQINDILVYDCATGINMDYVLYPELLGDISYNGINLDMNNVLGAYINYSSFNNSTSGAGIIATNLKTMLIMNSTVDNNTGNGLTLTNCDQNTFLQSSANRNGGNGIEVVSGSDDNYITYFLINNNTQNGLKLTATSDRNVITSSSLISNGAWGMNIAAATCDNNILIGVICVSNVSGSLTDSGTGTLKSTTVNKLP